MKQPTLVHSSHSSHFSSLLHTLAHFSHFSSLYTELSSTPVENIRQITPYLKKQTQFPPFFARKTPISRKNKPNSNPIKANFGPKSRVSKPNKPNSNPI
ncbi:MAG: hypothetical protein GY845_16145 [Planctomycetes bacterium]|nr:hypothetical protein [Planctomycetota bacterium]